MAQKIDLKKTRESFDKLLAQAKDSVKVLEALKNEGLAKAKAMLPPIPSKNEATKLANDKFVASLKKMGLATRKEVRDLEEKVEELATELRGQISKAKKAKKAEDASDEG